MNTEIRTAQKTTGKTTAKALLATLKGCRTGGLHGWAPDREHWSDAFVFDVVAGFTGGLDKRISVPGFVTPGFTDDGARFKPREGFWYLYAVTDRMIDALESVPPTAEVAFHVFLDAGTTEALRACKVHSDHLYLTATFTRRGKTVRRSFLLDVASGLHNTARFGG